MTRKEVVELLNTLEQKFPVHTWKMDDIHIWPLVKFEIFSSWRKNQYETSIHHFNKKQYNKKSTIKKSLVSLISSIAKIIALKLSKRKKLDLLLAGAEGHRVTYDEKFINRYYFPIEKELAKKRVNTLSLEYHSRNINKNYPPNILFIEDYLPYYNFLNLFSKSKKFNTIPELYILLNEFNRRGSFTIDIQNLNKKILRNLKIIKSQTHFFNLILKKYNPKIVFTLCYYSSIMYSLIYQSKKMNILTCDIQHGGIGNTHPAYSHFSNVPEDGYNILPEYFWTWDASSENILNKWINNQKHHKVFNGGNPWISYILNDNKNTSNFPDKKIILFTLQLDLPEVYILKAIKETNADYQWWLRMHPRTLKNKQRLIDYLKEHDVLDRINIEEATNFPLPKVLSNTYVHISKSSGSVIEAAQLGVPTIVLDSLGADNYADYIDEGKVIPCTNQSGQELLSLIKNINNIIPSKNSEVNSNCNYVNWIFQHLPQS